MLPGFIAVPTVLVVAAAFGLDSQGRPAHHHSNSVVAVVLPIAFSLLTIGVGLLVLRKMMRNPEGRFAPPLIAGLPRGQRGPAGRNVRRGTPSDDPTMAAVERETAARVVSQARFAATVFGVGLVWAAAQTVIEHSLPERIFDSAVAAFFAAMLIYLRRSVSRARRYLAAAAPSWKGPDGSTDS